MTWHDSDETREAIGSMAEKRFSDEYRCSCGGHFRFIGNQYRGCPDFTCDYCGRLIEMKFSPQSEQTGNIAVSAIPWEKYPDDLLIVTFVNEMLIGEYKKFIQILSPVARNPTHNKLSVLPNTKFYLISWKHFREYGELGLVNTP